jgi:surface antigen
MRVVLRIASVFALGVLPCLFLACGSNRGSDTATATGSVAPNGKIVIGGIAAKEIGRRMGEQERRIAAETEFRALEYGRSGAPVDWKNPATRHRGSIVPGRPYQAGNQYCRAYTHTIYTGTSPDMAKATACRSPDGTWRSVG